MASSLIEACHTFLCLPSDPVAKPVYVGNLTVPAPSQTTAQKEGVRKSGC
jgi:hypothetical protein